MRIVGLPETPSPPALTQTPMARSALAGALREAIERLLADPAERARLGANARAAVEERFSLDVYAASLAHHLEELAAP